MEEFKFTELYKDLLHYFPLAPQPSGTVKYNFSTSLCAPGKLYNGTVGKHGYLQAVKSWTINCSLTLSST